jgi:hypothetical protein
MINGTLIFTVAVGGTSLICCVVAIQSKYRRQNRRSPPDSFGSNTADVFGIGDGSHFGGSGGHHSASDHSNGSGDSGSSVTPVEGVIAEEEVVVMEAVAAAAINDAPPLARVYVLCRCHAGF